MSISAIIAICAFLLTLIIQVFSIGLFMGGLSTALKFIEEWIKRLEVKQDRHNNLIERVAICEQSTKSAHHRIDGIEKLEVSASR